MKRENKYLYGYKIMVNYGSRHGWEVVTYEDTLKEARQALRDYRVNQPQYPSKISAHREPNPNYKPDGQS